MIPSISVRTALSLLTAIGALLLARPACAGYYAIAANQPTVSGTTTITCSDPTSYNYPGSSNSASGVSYETTLKRATLHHEVSETWRIVWVPAEGEDETTDPPPTDGEGWEITYDLSGALNAMYDQYWVHEPGSAQGTITINDNSYGLSAEGTPDAYDEETYTQTSFYHFDPPTLSGDPEVVLPFLVSGTETEFVVYAVVDCEATGDMEMSLILGSSTPAKATEAIHHTNPKENAKTALGTIPRSVHNADEITASGWWTGRTDRSYQVGISWSGPSNSGQGPWYSTPFAVGSATASEWTSPYTITIQGSTGTVYTSTATLLYQISPTQGRATRTSAVLMVVKP